MLYADPLQQGFFRMSGIIVRSIRFDAADHSVEQGSVKPEVVSGLHPTWTFPLSANRADLLGEHFFVDNFPPNCSTKVDEKYTSASKQALGAGISEREIGRHRSRWGERT